MSSISIPKDFFQQQEDARRRSKQLIFYFILVVFFMVVVTYLILLFFPSFHSPTSSFSREVRYGGTSFWKPELFFFSFLLGGGVILIGSFIRMIQLRGGGSAVAEGLGGIKLAHDHTSNKYNQVLNVVEEMAIASGMPVPPVYLLPNENSINAFAAGFTTRDAVIGISEGSIDSLSRAELQGVIAHEFSHILNGDMRLSLRMIGLLFGIYSFYLLGRVLLNSFTRRRYSSGSSKGDARGAVIALGLALCFFGYLGVLFGRLIKAAVSRQREYLADASAVQFTRNPDGIAGALKKILLNYGSFERKDKAEEMSHMFFSDVISGFFSKGLFATHPPLKDRIKAISPENLSLSDIQIKELENNSSSINKPPFHESHVSSFLSSSGSGVSIKEEAEEIGFSSALVEAMGHPEDASAEYFKSLSESLPDKLVSKIHEPHGAVGAVLALLLEENNKEGISLQLSFLKANLNMGLFQETLKCKELMKDLPQKHKLPVLEMCLPALRSLSPSQYQKIRAIVKGLVNADNKCSLFEYVLQVVLIRNLDPNYPAYKKLKKHNKSLTGMKEDISNILSVLAASSDEFLGESSKDSEKAYLAGANELSLSLPFKSKELSLRSLDKSLNEAADLSPTAKKLLIKASTKVVTYDSKTSASELELLRAIYESLDCPIPPVLLNEVYNLSKDELAN